MDYTTNDALTILYRCGIQTVAILLKHLQRGGFPACERTIRTKLKKLQGGEVLEDGRKSNARPPTLGEVQLRKLKSAYEAAPLTSAPGLKQKAKLTCSPRTISRGLQKLGLKYMRIKPHPLIKEEHIRQRLEFAKAHQKDRLWRSTFFLDETTFQAYSSKKYCYQFPDKRIVNPRPKHPPKINAIAMVSFRGPSRLVLFEENMTALNFLNYLKLLVSDAEEMFARGRYRIYWDNDPKHKANCVKGFLQSNGVKVPSDWPSSSPDLNPIENAWGRMGTEIQKFTPRTMADLKKRLRSIWRQTITKAYCEEIVGSMSDRMQQLKNREGLKIDY